MRLVFPAVLLVMAVASGCQSNQATPRTTVNRSTPSGGIVPGQVPD